jgi:hypothetical protein
MVVGGGGRWVDGSSGFGGWWQSTGDDGPAAGGGGKWVPDQNPSLVAGGGDRLPSLTVVYFADSLAASSAIFAVVPLFLRNTTLEYA